MSLFWERRSTLVSKHCWCSDALKFFHVKKEINKNKGRRWPTARITFPFLFPFPSSSDQSKSEGERLSELPLSFCPEEEREPKERVGYGGYGEQLHSGAHSGDRPLPDRLWLRHRRRAPPQHGTNISASCLFLFAYRIHKQAFPHNTHPASWRRAEICCWILMFVKEFLLFGFNIF